MAVYTTELYNVLYSNLTEEEKRHVNPMNISDIPYIVKKAIPRTFFYFPIWDDKYRDVLCSKICTHYYFREIGMETPAIFIFRLNNKLNEIMPYYNELYKTLITKYEQLAGIDFFEDYVGKKDRDDVSMKIVDTVTDTSDNTKGASSENTSRDNEFSEHTDTVSGARGKATEEQESNETESSEKTVTDTAHEEGSESSNKHYSDKDGKTKEHDRTEKVTKDDTGKRTDNLEDETTFNITDKHEGTDTVTRDATDINRFSDTPQGGIALALADDNAWLTNLTHDKQHSVETTLYNSSTKRTGTETIAHTGTQGNVLNSTTSTTAHSDDTESGTRSGDESVTGSSTSETTTTESSTNSGNKEAKAVKTSSTEDNTSGNETRSGTGRDTGTKNLTNTNEYISRVVSGISDNSTLNSLENNIYTIHRHGFNNPNVIDAILKWRDGLVNIDMMVINDLKTLFMTIY